MQASPDRATLRTILFADLAHYSRLTAENELETLRFVTRCFEIFQENCDEFGAEFIKNTGDGALVLFEGVSSAIDYAFLVQTRVASLEQAYPVFGRFRIGLHVGEVRRRDGDAFGHAINVAARVEALAEPGGVCVTQDVYWAARNAGRFAFHFAGRPSLKNLPEALALYHVVPADANSAAGIGLPRLISVLDGFGVHRGDGEAVPLRSRKAQALVGFLALSNDLQDTLDRVIALIWPDRSPAAGRTAMLHCLAAAETAMGGDLDAQIFFRKERRIGLDPALVTVDVVRMLRDVREGRIDNVLVRRPDWPEKILIGLEDTSHLFRSWLSVARHSWRDHALELLEAMLDRFTVEEPALKRAATALLVIEPSHEQAARSLIRHHAATHELPAAMRVYQSLCGVLRDRYGIGPSSETTTLIRNLDALESQPARRAHVPRTDGRAPVIAIGRFEAQSKKVAVVVSGFRSELVANLSKFREFAVVEMRDIEPAAADVDYMLRAECAADRHSVQMTVLLEDPGTSRVVWSDTVQLSLESWLTVQKSLVGKIASTLEVYISQDRLTRLLQRMPDQMGVYELWLRGEDLLTRWNKAAEDEAERLFLEAIAADPNFAPAHASLASVLNARGLISPGIAIGDEARARAVELAQRAVALDPLDARNHLVVGWSNAMTRHFAQSEMHYELAAELNPNSPKTLVSAAVGLAFLGRVEPAQRLLERAMHLSSMFQKYQWSHIAVIRYFARDFEGAIDAADRSQNAIVDTVGWKVAALRKLGRVDEARAALAQLHASVAALWVGPVAATRKDVLDWFLSALPIRRDEDRADIAEMHSFDH